MQVVWEVTDKCIYPSMTVLKDDAAALFTFWVEELA